MTIEVGWVCECPCTFVHGVQLVENLDDKWQILGKFYDAMMEMDIKINTVVFDRETLVNNQML